MASYILSQANGMAQSNNALWYVMSTSDLATLESEQEVLFGTMAYIIGDGKMLIFGDDGSWYDMDGNVVSTS